MNPRLHLTLLIGMINIPDRMCIGFHSIPRVAAHAAGE